MFQDVIDHRGASQNYRIALEILDLKGGVGDVVQNYQKHVGQIGNGERKKSVECVGKMCKEAGVKEEGLIRRGIGERWPRLAEI